MLQYECVELSYYHSCNNGKEVIRAQRDVSDEDSMWTTTLQDLKSKAGRDVESNIINLRENTDIHVNADM